MSSSSLLRKSHIALLQISISFQETKVFGISRGKRSIKEARLAPLGKVEAGVLGSVWARPLPPRDHAGTDDESVPARCSRPDCPCIPCYMGLESRPSALLVESLSRCLEPQA
jgi:hypothetical protein